MNNVRKSVINLVVTIFVAMAFVALEKPVDVMAASEPQFCGTNYQFMHSPEWDSYGLTIGNLSDKAKVKVSVNKKSVATAIWDDRQDIVWVHSKKPGTVKVTMKVTQNGKTYKHVTKMTWVKYKNPLKSLSIGSKKYDVKYFDGNTQAAMKKQSGNKVVKVKLKPGYTITSLGFSRGGKYINIKNGSKIKFNKKGDENTVLFINYKDPKGKEGLLRLFADKKNFTYY